MNFVQMTTGRGGWPMNVFITPDKKPFFGGTYFPTQPRYGMPSWSQILLSIKEAYRFRREEVEESAASLIGELTRMSKVKPSGSSLTGDLPERAFARIGAAFDRANGGFGGAPKFPQPMTLEFLLRYHDRTGNEAALEMVTITLDKMAAGGIYDQLGGGFHRYAVDAIWLVPHFEKMLYDNAQLARIYLHTYQITGAERYRTTVNEILGYVEREMLDVSGAFYSTQDADSEGEEGKFFVWTPEEIVDLLGRDDAQVFKFFYDVSDGGNFEGQNILNRGFTTAAAAAALKMDEMDLIESLTRSRDILFEHRESRIKPHRDEKSLTSWNALMAAAFADAGAVLNVPKYIDIAERNVDFVLKELCCDGRVLRTWKDGRAKLNGYLEDHAFLADALLETYRSTGKIRYFKHAKDLVDSMIEHFWDEENGGFFFTSNDHEPLAVRTKDIYDNAIPSGNSVAADVLIRTSRLSGDERYEKFAVATLRLMTEMIARSPTGFGRALSAIEHHFDIPREIVIVGDAADGVRNAIYGRYLPTVTLARSTDPDEDAAHVSLFAERRSDNGALVYFCENSTCQLPIRSVEETIIGLDRLTKRK